MTDPRYFYTAIVGFLVGVAVGSVVDLPRPYLALGTVITTSLAVVSYRYGSDVRVAAVLLGLFFCLLGWWRIDHAFSLVGQSPLESLVGETVVVEGVVVREPDVRERSTHLTVRTRDTDTLLLVSVDRYQPVAYSDRLSISGTLTRPEAFQTDLGRTFDYPGYLLARGIEYQMRYPDLEVVASGEGVWLIAKLLEFKQSFLDGLARVIPEPAFGLGAGMLLGVKQALGEDLETAFRKSGLIHLVVLSGFNLSIVAIAVMALLSFVLPLRPRVVVGILALVLFALLVGFSATVLRATLMAILSLWALASGRQYLVLRALCAAAAAMVAWNPFLLLSDVGFQFSCLATLGLIVVTSGNKLADSWSLRQVVRNLVLATVAAQVAVTPLLLYHIGEMSFVSLPANLLVLPLVAAAMLATFVTGVCALIFPAVAPLAAYPTTFILTYIIEMAYFWSGFSIAAVAVPPLPLWSLGIMYGLLGVGVWWWKYPRPVAMVKEDQDIDISNWTIVEEKELVPEKVRQDAKGAGSQRDPAPTEPPIFFR